LAFANKKLRKLLEGTKESMKRKLIKIALVWLVIWVLSPPPAQAGPTLVFLDNLDLEHGGTGIKNYTGFENWGVSDGSVDLLGNGYHDFFPDHGLYVDLDGSTLDAGKLSLDNPFNLQPGTYVLTFELAGSQRRYGSPLDTVMLQVNGGSLLDKTYSVDWNIPFTTFTETFAVTSMTHATLIFECAGGDNIGPLLDNVTLTLSHTPAPGSIVLGGIGVGLVGWLRRRRSI